MAPGTTPPTTEARAVFRELGYTVSEEGADFVAERKWRQVLVTPLGADDATDPEPYLADGGSPPQLRCFVTWRDSAADLREHLLDLKPPFDWAVIGVEDGDEFSVMQGAPGSP